jgi:hypothetical protein
VVLISELSPPPKNEFWRRALVELVQILSFGVGFGWMVSPPCASLETISRDVLYLHAEIDRIDVEWNIYSFLTFKRLAEG